ncbi:hypothetical protein FKW77_005241 [Venturia effusa]|uniref:polynucleotide adenylyltransferase n=1 Tax=Venturia effusa TaxID=50376 RepID=A0A517LIQ4_9PEZI|nr:hypothetical protein FKW77_005241 [Venturia effusa]
MRDRKRSASESRAGASVTKFSTSSGLSLLRPHSLTPVTPLISCDLFYGSLSVLFQPHTCHLAAVDGQRRMSYQTCLIEKMGKSKQTRENAELEQQLRNMILSNVRMAPAGNNSSQAPSNHGPQADQRGPFQYVPPHLRNSNPQSNHPAVLPGSINTPGAILQQPISPNVPRAGPRHQQNRQGVNQAQQGSQDGRDYSNHPAPVHSDAIRPSPLTDALHSNPRVLRRPHGYQQEPPSASGNAFAGNMAQQRTRQLPSAPPMAAFAAQCEYLERMAATKIPNVEMREEEYAAKQEFRSKLEAVAQSAVRASFPDVGSILHLQCYGSLASGFATEGSDVDLTIVWEGPNPDDPVFAAELPRTLEKGILDAGFGARLLSRTRIPIIKICEKPTDELYNALKEARQNWEALPNEEKYPSLAPPSPSLQSSLDPSSVRKEPANANSANGSQVIDPDVSRRGKAMQSEKPVMAKEGTLAYLEQLKATDRSHLDNLESYCTRFINTASKLLRSGQIDDDTAARYFLEGMPPAVQTDVLTAVEAHTDKADVGLFDRYYDAAMPIIAVRTKSKPRMEKPWLREKTLGPLDFPKTGVGIQADINFSNALAIHNTQLLRCYCHCDMRVRLMVLFVKAWAKRRKINSAYSGTLSSYGYVLMVLHFLINVARPPVIPNLQRSFGAENREVMAHGYNISFWNDEDHIRQLSAQRQLTQNTELLGSLLRGFFHYFAAQGPQVAGGGFNWMKDVISIRTPLGILSKEGKGWTGAKTITMDNREVRQRYLFAIEDPFELDHNVARPVTHHGIVTIRDEFRRAWRILQSIGHSRPPEGGLFDMIEEAANKSASVQSVQQDGAKDEEHEKAKIAADGVAEAKS